LKGQALVGAGAVLCQAQVDAPCNAGGRLMVMPHADEALTREVVQRGLHVVAGFATASEAFAALRVGAHALKLFPTNDSAPETLRALRAVLIPELPVLAVGGVKPDKLHACIAARCLDTGLGSDLYRPGQWPQTTSERAVASVQAWRALPKP
jgi:2-dehydro-3-deoxyphosphogalactonate aldolase